MFTFVLTIKGMESRVNNYEFIKEDKILDSHFINFNTLFGSDLDTIVVMFHKKKCAACLNGVVSQKKNNKNNILNLRQHTIFYRSIRLDNKVNVNGTVGLTNFLWNFFDQNDSNPWEYTKILSLNKYTLVSFINYHAIAYNNQCPLLKLERIKTSNNQRKCGKNFGTLLFLEMCCAFFKNNDNSEMMLESKKENIEFWQKFGMSVVISGNSENSGLFTMSMKKKDLVDYFNSKEKIIIDTLHAQNIREFLKCNEIDFEDRYWNDINQKIRNSKFFNFFKHLFIKN